MILRQVSGVLSTQIAIYGLQVVTSVVLARLLGPEMRGTVVVATLFATFVFALTNFGLPGAIIYNISRAADKKAGLEEALSLCMRFLCLFPLLCLVIYAIGFVVGANTFLKGVSFSVLVGSFALCFAYQANGLVLSLLNGLQDYKWRNIVNILPTMGLAVFLAVAWIASLHVNALLLVWLNAWCVLWATLVGAVWTYRCYRPALTFALPAHWKQSYGTYGLKSYIALIAQQMNYRLDTFIVNAILSNSAVGIYSVGVAVAELILFIPNAASLVLFPKIASLPDDKKDDVAMLALGGASYLVGFCCLGMSFLLPWLIPIVYGKPFASAVPAALWLLPGMLGLTVVKILSSLVAGYGKPELMTYATVLGLIATVALDMALIPRYGFVGAAYASSIAYWVSALYLILLQARLSRTSLKDMAQGMITEPVVWFQKRVLLRNASSA